MAKSKNSFSIIHCRITLNALNIDAALECELDIPLIICNTSKNLASLWAAALKGSHQSKEQESQKNHAGI